MLEATQESRPSRTEGMASLYLSEFFAHLKLNLNSVKKLIFVMVKCGVLFEVRTGFLNNI
jgi:hypothetical protein